MLEGDIEAGKYAIGGKLPSERLLVKLFNASHVTVRQGIDVLAKKGLVRREPGSGIYVNATKASPVIGILFGPSLVEESAHFYRALRAALESEIEGKPYTCCSYDGFNRTAATAPESALPYQQLHRDSHSHSFKGCIQISLTDPSWNDREPLKRIPRATHGEMIGDVWIDYSFFVRNALEFVVKNKARKIVYLRSFLTVPNDIAALGDMARRMKIPTPEIVQLECDGQSHDLLAHDKVCDLAMKWSNTDSWPDAMIVTDDIATRGVVIALIKAGIKIPSDMLLVTQANEGINHHYGADVVRYAISPTEIARNLIFVLEKRMSRLKVNIPQIITGGWAPDSLSGRRSKKPLTC